MLIPDVVGKQGSHAGKRNIAEKHIHAGSLRQGKDAGKVDTQSDGKLSVRHGCHQKTDDHDREKEIRKVGSGYDKGKADGKNHDELTVTGSVEGEAIRKPLMPQGEEKNSQKQGRQGKNADFFIEKKAFPVGKQNQACSENYNTEENARNPSDGKLIFSCPFRCPGREAAPVCFRILHMH